MKVPFWGGVYVNKLERGKAHKVVARIVGFTLSRTACNREVKGQTWWLNGHGVKLSDYTEGAFCAACFRKEQPKGVGPDLDFGVE